jgi:hypothetical protein
MSVSRKGGRGQVTETNPSFRPRNIFQSERNEPHDEGDCGELKLACFVGRFHHADCPPPTLVGVIDVAEVLGLENGDKGTVRRVACVYLMEQLGEHEKYTDTCAESEERVRHGRDQLLGKMSTA